MLCIVVHMIKFVNRVVNNYSAYKSPNSEIKFLQIVNQMKHYVLNVM